MIKTLQSPKIDAIAKKERDSNFELLRIIAMFFVITNHYVINSGLTDKFDFNNVTVNMIFLQCTYTLGLICLNAYMILTGYFSCMGNFKVRKWLKILFEIWFYRIVCHIVFIIPYNDYFTFKLVFKAVFQEFFMLGKGYTSTLVFMYLLIPVMNMLIKHLSKIMYLRMLFVLIFAFSVIPSLTLSNQIPWIEFMILCYFIGGYLRKFPCSLFESKFKQSVILVSSIAILWIATLAVNFVGSKHGFTNWRTISYFSNKFFVLTASLALFLIFRSVKIKNNRVINKIAASTFGVLIIHGNNEMMRNFIWIKLFKNVEFYDSAFLPLHMFISIMIIYSICTVIDMLRIRFIETPLFKQIDKISDKAMERYIKIESRLLQIFE